MHHLYIASKPVLLPHKLLESDMISSFSSMLLHQTCLKRRQAKDNFDFLLVFNNSFGG